MTRFKYSCYYYLIGKYRQVYLFSLNIPTNVKSVYVSIYSLQIYVMKLGWESLYTINRYIKIT